MSTPVELTLTDPGEPDIDERGAATALCLRLLRDARDIPFLKVIGLQSALLFPCAWVLFAHFSWWLAALHWILVFGIFLPRYTLVLHLTSHRKLFRKEWSLLNQYIPTVLGPLMGQTPGTYFAHHIGMHHPENNLESDLSTTMPFQRDSFLAFLRYYGRFMTRGTFELVAYLRRAQRPRLARQVFLGELAWLALVAAGCAVSWRAALVVLVVPLVAIRFLMMAGNWGQHAFVDAEAPENCYRNSISCINTGYNRRAFNDGYHIGHHLSATRHWTEMPSDLKRSLRQYIDERAIVFEGIDFFEVWLFLMLKRYDWLARRFVRLDDRGWTEGEIVALLRERTRRIAAGPPAAPAR
jgi:fatty acid desaturase